MEKKCSLELGKARKSCPIDKLSNLLDFILCHIISFLHTKEAAQTSVLSQRWRCVWKYIPVLHLSHYSFRDNRLLLIRYVRKIFASRYRVNLDKISYQNYDEEREHEPGLCRTVIQYAFSHNAQHIDINLDADVSVTFSELFGSILNCGLKTLKLQFLSYDVGSFCFQMLTTLELQNCWLGHDYIDLSINFPCLVNLYIAHCSSETGIKVFAPQLLNLKLLGTQDYSIEIVAPELKFFSFVTKVTNSTFCRPPNFSLPCLDHAEVLVSKKLHLSEGRLELHLNPLFTGLRNAKSVMLRCYTIEDLDGICKFLEHKTFNFTKLESLVCVSDESLKVVKYAVDGSPGEEPHIKHFRRVSLVSSYVTWRSQVGIINLSTKRQDCRNELSWLRMALGFYSSSIVCLILFDNAGCDKKRYVIRNSINELLIVYSHFPLPVVSSSAAVLIHQWCESFREYLSFQIYVDKVLSLRYPLSLREIKFIDQGNSEDRDGSLFASVIDYAFSHGAQYLFVNLRNFDNWERGTEYYFSDLFGTISDCNLKTLKLDTLLLDFRYQSSGFRMLTKLELFDCMYVSDHEEFVDSFSEFPCLEHLVLDSVYPENHEDYKIFRISSLRLLSLSVTYTNFKKFEIYAPKLKYFYLENWWDFVEFRKLNLPSLEYAKISVYHDGYSVEHCSDECTECLEYAKHGLIFLLQGLKNVTALKLGPSLAELLTYIPAEFLEQQPSPFTSLKALSLRHDDLPDAVINYFVKGSSETLTPIHNSIDQLLVVYSSFEFSSGGDSLMASSSSLVYPTMEDTCGSCLLRNKDSESFREYPRFQLYVYKVLSLRYPLTVREVKFIDEGESEDRDGSLFASVIHYAIFHGAQHLFVNLQNLDNWESNTEYNFSELFGTISVCNLKTLKLDTLLLDFGYQCSGFRMLTKLELFECMFVSDHEEFVDSFSEFPCLEHLVLDSVYPENHEDDKIFRISGLRLLSLSVRDTNFMKLEICAPKLRYFYFRKLSKYLEFTKLNLPSLDYADISVYHDHCSDEVHVEYAKHGLISLLQGLSNVTALKMGPFTAELLSYIPAEFLEQQPSPFTRLKALSLRHDDLPEAVINYFVKGSSGTKPVVKFAP
ncbi:F-box/FBD/LRR-repeat protein At1g16930 [Linum perenne]